MGCSWQPQRDKMNLVRCSLCIIFQLAQGSVQMARTHTWPFNRTRFSNSHLLSGYVVKQLSFYPGDWPKYFSSPLSKYPNISPPPPPGASSYVNVPQLLSQLLSPVPEMKISKSIVSSGASQSISYAGAGYQKRKKNKKTSSTEARWC